MGAGWLTARVATGHKTAAARAFCKLSLKFDLIRATLRAHNSTVLKAIHLGNTWFVYIEKGLSGDVLTVVHAHIDPNLIAQKRRNVLM